MTRDLLKLVYKSLTIFVTLVLAGGAVLAYWHATPSNQLLLVCGILGVLALITGLSISKYDMQDERLEESRRMLDEARARFPVSVRFGGFGKRGEAQALDAVDWAAGDERVSVNIADPEVHRVDTAMLDEARRMAAQGAPIDDICRYVDPSHDRNDPLHQEAFRRLVRAMIDEA